MTKKTDISEFVWYSNTLNKLGNVCLLTGLRDYELEIFNIFYNKDLPLALKMRVGFSKIQSCAEDCDI